VSRDDQVAYRFVVRAGDGRRSAQWRVWTGSRNNAPSDEVYIAPRSLGSEVKVSLHSDGTCLYKLTKKANPQARLGDRHALHRWTIEDDFIPGTSVRRGLRLRFPEDELVAGGQGDAGVAVVGAPPAGSALLVWVLVSDEPIDVAKLGVDVLAVLTRANGGQVAMVSRSQPWDSEQYRQQIQRVGTGVGWAAPVTSTGDGYAWLFSGGESLCEFTEFASSRHQHATDPVPLPPFEGKVAWLPDSDLPEEIRGRDDLCGVVRMTLDGDATLYVDRRARCDHSRLGVNAEEIRQSWMAKRSDGVFETLPDGSRITRLATLGLYGEGLESGKIPRSVRVGYASFSVQNGAVLRLRQIITRLPGRH